VGQRPDEAGRGSLGQRGIGVERDHEANPLELGGLAFMDCEAGVVVAPEQPVELVELSALALPAHPSTLDRVEAAFPVEQVEGAGSIGITTPIEIRDAAHGLVEKSRVFGAPRLIGFGEAGEQHETQIRAGVRQPVTLDLAQQMLHVLGAAEQARNHHGGLVFGRDAALEGELGKHGGGEDP
jgi:hypothetical protein